MTAQFEWQIDDDEDAPRRGRKRSPVDWRRRLGMALLLLVAMGLGGVFVQRQLTRAERELKAEVQAVLDLERSALVSGDGELFKSTQLPDASWLSTRLQPANQAVIRHGLTVDRVEADELEVRAVLTWQEEETQWQQLAFFERRGPRLQRGPGLDAFWGESRWIGRDWGRMQYWEADTDFRLAIAEFIDAVVIDTCEKSCLTGRMPMRVIIAPDGSQTSDPAVIRLPSPRLVALDGDGQPGAPFWTMLETAVQSHLTPATVVFAVDAAGISHYRGLAREFMAAQPDIAVEIVPYDSAVSSAEQVALLSTVDGAALRPDVDVVAAGHVVDLTNLALGDATFDQADFYEQIWRGAWWEERLWMLPQSAEMRLLSYDRAYIARADLTAPGLLWTWDELTADIQTVMRTVDDPDLRWGFLDISNHFLLAYAYNWENRCSAPFTAGCNAPLAPTHVAAALTWYKMMVDDGLAPDVSTLTPAERISLRLNVAGVPRRVVTWVAEPANYEHQSQLSPLGVAPFPGATGYDGVTPLWVWGNVISSHSDNMPATWAWLKFLSYRSIDRSLRFVPARPSVAQATGFWQTLPPQLGRAMHATFPYARPILMAEAPLFDWTRVEAILSGERQIAEVARIPVTPRWFGADLAP